MTSVGSACISSIRRRTSWKCPNSATASSARAVLSASEIASAASSDTRKNAVRDA